ncbi:HSP20-like chaperone [Fusarium tricinctum]|uniref:HSP20-like chaperone n=1 Tax=Fusarium tricinctum TaxID=61284 RepID=A0A8K0SF95_9HYPO|nr:HSP20-like chaperone [Fusarium tricinctum]
MSDTVYPEVLWAQRSSVADASKNFIYLTITVPDVPKDSLTLDLQPTKLTFTGTSSTLKRKYHVELEFWGEVDPAESKINHTAKNVEIKLQKKDLKEEYWPRLLKEPKRMHFLKTDFDKWVDEDEQNEAPEDDFSQFGGMGGMPGMGDMGDMGGMGGMPGMGGDFGGIDFSKLGGAGAGFPGAEGGDELDDDEDDDDMPALEGDDKKEAAPAAAPAAATEKKD